MVVVGRGGGTAVLGIPLLEIAEALDEHLARNVLVVGTEVALGGLSGVVDEDVGVGGHACYCAYHVAVGPQLE